ncbi:MAG: AMP-binding protein [Eubacterium sp.]|nr:AMP-binding protein [Eubacterium sp.]
MCKNRIGALAGYVALMSAKDVPLMLSADIDPELLKNLIGTYSPDYIWMPAPETEHTEKNDEIHDQKYYSDPKNPVGMAKSQEKQPSRVGSTVDVTDGVKGEIILYKYGYELVRLKSQAEIDELTKPLTEDEMKNGKTPRLHPDLAILMTTSGSTGSPKLVRQSYQNVYANAEAISDYLDLDDYERAITTLPMSYTYGLSVINSHLLVGARVLMTDVSYAQRGFWDFFKREKATSIAGVPYTYEMLDRMKFFRMMLPSLKTMTQAGGRLRPDLHEKFADFCKTQSKKFFVMYGQTEATARMSYLPYTRSLEKVGSIGVAIPGGAFSLIDENGKEITAPGETGELVYNGANVTMGYAECLDDLSKGDERNGTLFTGDIAKFDEDGYFYIVGRKSRFLKIFGNRVNLEECEKLIENHFQVEAACTGEDDLMKVYITGKIKGEVVAEFISGKTGLNVKAFEVKNVPSIPRSGSGKKAYGELE